SENSSSKKELTFAVFTVCGSEIGSCDSLLCLFSARLLFLTFCFSSLQSLHVFLCFRSVKNSSKSLGSLHDVQSFVLQVWSFLRWLLHSSQLAVSFRLFIK